MWSYLIRRSVHSLIVLFIITSLCFCAMRLMPGNFWMQAPGLTEEDIIYANQQKHLFGLDQPFFKQYFVWMKQLLHGSLGIDFNYVPINNYIWKYVSNSLILLGTAFILTLAIALPWGIHNSKKPNGSSDKIGLVLSLIGYCIPVFVLGHWLQAVFSFQLLWLPPSSMHDPSKVGDFTDLLVHMVLPVSTLTIGLLAYYLKFVRESMVDIFSSSFLVAARAKGVSEQRVTYRHALRNGSIPIITVIMLDFPTLISSSAVVENVFNWNGIGTLMVHSVSQRNYPVLIAIILIIATFVVLANWLADMLYVIVDPRVKLNQKVSDI